MVQLEPLIPSVPIFLTPIEFEEFTRNLDPDIVSELARRWDSYARKENTRVNYLSKKMAHIAQKTRQTQINNLSSAELRAAFLLCNLGIKYEHQHIIYTYDSFILADLFLPEYNIIIEVHGNSHYTNQSISFSDKDRTRFLLSRGYSVRILDNLQALTFTPDQLHSHLLSDLNIPKSYERNTCTDAPGARDDSYGPSPAPNR